MIFKRQSAITGHNLVQCQNSTCDGDWIQFGHSCLKLYSTAGNFDAAQAICQNSSSQLVEIDSLAKEKFIESSVLSSSILDYWIGLKDVNNDNKLSSYKWVTSNRSVVSIGYSNWGTGLSSSSDNNCTALMQLILNTWGWLEKKCQEKYFFICQSGIMGCKIYDIAL